MRSRPLLTYFLLAFAITWSAAAGWIGFLVGGPAPVWHLGCAGADIGEGLSNFLQ